jgi:hypothetical protein
MLRPLIKSSIVAAALGAAAITNSASAHIVGLGWVVQPNGDVTFSALHWHDHFPADGTSFLIVDGTSYVFTSHTFDVNEMPAQGALVNSTYSSFDGDSLNAINVENDWLHVTVSGLSTGAHTLTAPNHATGLTDWTLNGNITTAPIVLPPPSGAVSDTGSSLGMLGAAFLGLAAIRRRLKK